MKVSARRAVPQESSTSHLAAIAKRDQDAERVVVWAPVGRTCALITEVLEQTGMCVASCEDIDDFCDIVREGAGVALLTEEVFTTNGKNAERIAEFLESQPSWSDLPVKVFMTDHYRGTSRADQLRKINPQRSVTILERPIRPAVLVSVTEAALRNRRRQYELRDALQDLEKTNESLDERVREQTADLRRLARRLTRAEQAERRRISQLLHDDLQQLLYGLNLKLSALNSQLEDWPVSKVHSEMEEARTWVEDAFGLTRELTSDLSPPVLEGTDLTAAIQWLRIHMQNLCDLDVTVESRGPHRIEDEDLLELVFQIVRELLFNVKKHAKTTEATVRMTEADGHLVIHVIDEGRGFDIDAAAERDKEKGGFGLFSAAKRLDLMGGKVEIDSSPGKGTHVTIYPSV